MPANSQHYNGCEDRMIKSTKRLLSGVAGGADLTFSELSTVLLEIAQILNSRPLMKQPGVDIFAGGPITPNHLLLGRASADVPGSDVDSSATITRRLRFVTELVNNFWKKWFVQVFPTLIPSFRWKKEARDVRVGDVVLMKDASLLSKKFTLAKITAVKAGEDGHVRSVDLQYKNPGHRAFTTVTRSVHNLVVVVPVDWSEEDVERAVQEDLKSLHRGELGGVSRE